MDTLGAKDKDASRAAFCGHCGESLTGLPHDACEGRLALEPPRFCVVCRRRMKVQVAPRGWSAECVRHGIVQG